MKYKKTIKENFSKSAENYEQHAKLQKDLADRIFNFIKELRPNKILDIGCGTGYLAYETAKHFTSASVIGIDIAEGMVNKAKREYQRDNLKFDLQDGEVLPFEAQTFDLIVSNASMQWMDSYKVLLKAKEILKSGRKYVFTTFGPKTLFELKECGFRVNDFLPAEELELLAKRAGYEVEKLSSEEVKREYSDLKQLIKSLKETGAHGVKIDRKKSGNGFKAMKTYKEKYCPDGRALATFEVIFCSLISRG